MTFRVLVVDDDEILRSLLSSVLRLEGFATETASDGQEALEKIKTQRPDLIVSDICMPICDGIELQKMVEALDPPVIPMLFMSGYVGSNESSLQEKKNFAGFLEKPFKVKAVTEIISRFAKDTGTPA